MSPHPSVEQPGRRDGKGPSSCLIALISDTHGVVPEAELLGRFRGAHMILHAGDVGHHGGEDAVLHALRTAAPVAAVRGNVDDQAGCQLPDHAAVDACGWSALVAHIVGRPPQVEPAAAALIERLQPDIVIYGHSHKYSVDEHGGRVYINPGSAGPARFSLPRTAALLHLPPKGSGRPRVEAVELPRTAPTRQRSERGAKRQRRR